jgi:hypothetical protein
MVIADLPMEQIYELLAFVVALYFPVALVAWLVIDKFFVSSDKAHAVRGQSDGSRPSNMLADHPGHKI